MAITDHESALSAAVKRAEDAESDRDRAVGMLRVIMAKWECGGCAYAVVDNVTLRQIQALLAEIGKA
jgi:hypothetical protein